MIGIGVSLHTKGFLFSNSINIRKLSKMNTLHTVHQFGTDSSTNIWCSVESCVRKNF